MGVNGGVNGDTSKFLQFIFFGSVHFMEKMARKLDRIFQLRLRGRLKKKCGSKWVVSPIIPINIYINLIQINEADDFGF